jgi:uncharacterized protein (DUF169 family)
MLMNARLEELLGLKSPAVAIAFVDQPPEGIARAASGEPASCGYWRRAAEGEVFYTDASHHQSCPVGAHTHGVAMSAEKKDELMGLVKTMVGLEYLNMEEVSAIPRRTERLQYAVYAPLAKATFAPDVVLVRADVRQMMLLAEAAQSAGVASSDPTAGRPTCAVLPQSLQAARVSSSFGCVGNRVYTGAGDHEGYMAIPSTALDAVTARLEVIVHANRELEKFHRQRQAAFTA